MKSFLVIIAFTIGYSAAAQADSLVPLCGPDDILDKGLSIEGYKVNTEPLPNAEIPGDSILKGFKLQLRDTAIRIKSFVVLYSTGDIVREYRFSGCTLDPQNAVFLKDIKAGDMLTIECVRIQKNEYKALSTSLIVLVI